VFDRRAGRWVDASFMSQASRTKHQLRRKSIDDTASRQSRAFFRADIVEREICSCISRKMIQICRTQAAPRDSSPRARKSQTQLRGRTRRILKAQLPKTALTIALAILLAHSASANLVQDGTFTDVAYSGSLPMTTLFGMFGTPDSTIGTSSQTLTVNHWATSGYNFVYAPGTVDSGTSSGANSASVPNEAPGQFNAANGYGNTYMWGSNNGGASTWTNVPSGGNFVAADGAYEQGAITQSITGLTIGKAYQLNFWYGAAQQQSFNGATTETWQVMLGSESYNTTTINLANNAFSGWQQGTMWFTATATSETLSFLASGTPNGEPPFSLLGGVDLEPLPDFSNWMVFAGFGAVCIMFEVSRRRRHPTLRTRLALTAAP
jgi:hypothetical protein